MEFLWLFDRCFFLQGASDFNLIFEDLDYVEQLRLDYPIYNLGVSVYNPSEVSVIQSNTIGIAIQFPLNVLNSRFERVHLTRGRRYARSIFLRGLLAPIQNLKPCLSKELVDFHVNHHNQLQKFGLDPISLALTFVYTSNAADFFLFGVETHDLLKNIIEAKLIEAPNIETVTSNITTH